MSVAIVTDSASSVPADLAARLGIEVVPMRLVVGDESVRDGTLPLADVLAHGHGITTSGPTPGDFAEALERATAGGRPALVLTIAETMSSTAGAARLAAKLVEAEVRVLDTQTAAGAEGLVVVAAAERAAAGADLDEVEAAARAAIESVRLIAWLDSLDWLVRSGRVPGIAGWAGRRLGLRPLFEFRRGKVRRLRPATSDEAAVERIVGACLRDGRPGARLHLAGLHAMDPDAAARLVNGVRAHVEPATCFIGEFSPVMVAHTGPGLAGLAWRWEPAG